MTSALYCGLFDDAALFPPGNAPMGEALPAHRAHRAGARAPYVGPFLVSDGRIAELRAVLAREEGDHGPLDVVVTVPGGSDDLAAAIEAITADPALSLVGVEVAAPPDRAGDTAVALAATLPRGVGGHVEIARGERAASDIASLVGTGAHAKFRTGGVRAEAHPSEAELAALLATAVNAGLPFKCTAGLHHAVRHTTPEGFEQHGFLNVLLATRLLLDGEGRKEAAATLADRDGRALAARAAALTETEIADVRSRFRSFGTCSVTEPLEDLVVLGALTL